MDGWFKKLFIDEAKAAKDYHNRGGGSSAENKLAQVADKSVTEITADDLEGATSIRDHLFSRCMSLSNVNLPDTVTSIGDYAFEYCPITSLYLSKNLTTIGERVFQYAQIKSVVFPDKVTTIKEGAFYSNSYLTSITFPTSIQVCEKNAFGSSSKHRSLYIEDLLAFCNIDFKDDYAHPLYGSGNYLGSLYLNGTHVTELILPAGFSNSVGQNTFCACDITSAVIPDGATSIGTGMFRNCKSLANISIPDSVTSIGKYAFYCCPFTNTQMIPDSVTSIGESAFRGCKSLLSVNIPGGVTKIEAYVFSNCDKLASVTIHNKVTSIGDYAFNQCTSLLSITLPDSVTTISKYAFYTCRNLKDIYVPWAEGAVANAPWGATNATIHYNSEVQ